MCRISLVVALTFAGCCLLPPTPAHSQTTAEAVNAAFEKYYAAQKAAEKAAAEAAAAQMKAAEADAEVAKQKAEQQAAQEALDASKAAERLAKEIEELKKKLMEIEKAKQDAVNKLLNPDPAKPTSALEKEAFGSATTPTTPAGIRKAFDELKEKLKKELAEKEKALEEAKKKAPPDAGKASELTAQSAALADSIKDAEAKAAAARKAAEEAAAAAKKAAEEAAKAEAEYRAMAAKRAKEQEIEKAKEELKKAQEAVRASLAALKAKEAELTGGSGIAEIMKTLFGALAGLLEAIEKVGGENPDSPMGAIANAEKALEELLKILNDPNSTISQVIRELLASHYKTLRDNLRLLRLAQERLDQALAAVKPPAPMPKPIGGEQKNIRRSILENPHSAFSQPAAQQLYAALERAVDRGNLAEVSRIVGEARSLAGDSPDAGLAGELHCIANTGQAVVNLVEQMKRSGKALIDDLNAQPPSATGFPTGPRQTINLTAPVRVPYSGQLAENGELVNIQPGTRFALTRPNLVQVVNDAFSVTILPAPPTAGGQVMKGNAQISMGSSTPTITISLVETPQMPMPGQPPAEKTVNAKPNEQGNFSLEIPPGWTPRRLMMGGPDQTSLVIDEPCDSGQTQIPWDHPDVPPQLRGEMINRYIRLDRAVTTMLTGQPAEIVSPEASAIRGLQFLSRIKNALPEAVGPSMPHLEFIQVLEKHAEDSGPIVSYTWTPPAPRPGGATQINLRIAENLPGNTQSPDHLVAGNGPITQPFSGDPEKEREAVIQQTFWLYKDIATPSRPGQIMVTPHADLNQDWEARYQAMNPSDPIQQRLKTTVEQTVPPGSKVTVELAEDFGAWPAGPVAQVFPEDPAPSGPYIYYATLRSPRVYNVQVTDTALKQIPLNRPALQTALDADPKLGGNAGVDLPRDAQLAPNDPFYSSTGSWGEKYGDQWALRRIGCVPEADQSAWPADASKLKECIVAVIGTGVDWTHPDLTGQMWINPYEDPYNGRDDDRNGYIDDQFGWNFRDNNRDVMDVGGHDTHVAGTIAARTGNGRGIAGVNPAARIMALKTANHLGQSDAVSIARAIVYATRNGARVINISYGGGQPSPIERRAMEVARAYGVLVVVASGNQGSDVQNAALVGVPGTLTVAATGVDDKRAAFSNWGQPVDLAAPGMDVLGLRAAGTDFLLYTGDNPNYDSGRAIVGPKKDLYRASGTSFAAPLASGAASLLLSSRPNLTARQIRNMLLMSADDLDVPGWDQNTGAGMLNAKAAMAADPNRYLVARIAQVRPVRRDGAVQIEVTGQAVGTKVSGRWLQVGFGENPAKDAWENVGYSAEPQPGGPLGMIPTAKLNRRGVWTVRMIVQDDQKTIREARATLNLQ